MNWSAILPERSGALYAAAVLSAEQVLDRLPEGAPSPTFDPRSDGSITLRWGGLTVDCAGGPTVDVTVRRVGQAMAQVCRAEVATLDMEELLR